jgi:hypothetical protein
LPAADDALDRRSAQLASDDYWVCGLWVGLTGGGGRGVSPSLAIAGRCCSALGKGRASRDRHDSAL